MKNTKRRSFGINEIEGMEGNDGERSLESQRVGMMSDWMRGFLWFAYHNNSTIKERESV